MSFKRSTARPRPLPPVADRFGLRSVAQVRRDLAFMIRRGAAGAQFQLDLSSIHHLRPGLSLPAYAGLMPTDGRAPILNLFDRAGGGQRYTQRVSKTSARDFRGQALTYDEHDGVDFVCPVGTPLCAAAPGTVVLIRDRWLRGGLTVTVDHGRGLSTQYTHCSRAVARVGESVARGQVVALSGSSGLDMTSGFPWVPPHVHFMVWLDGQAVDPFVAQEPAHGEAGGVGDDPHRPGTWRETNDPQPARSDEIRVAQSMETSPLDGALAREIVASCSDPAIAEELRALAHRPASLGALLEDALHHDTFAFPPRYHRRALREPDGEAAGIGLSLPLPGSEYRGAVFADRSADRVGGWVAGWFGGRATDGS